MGGKTPPWRQPKRGNMYEEILQKLGLSANEARLYELLLTKGRVKARDLVGESGLGRGNVYNILTALAARGLATVIEGKQQIYQAAEPTKLAGLVDEQKRKTDRLSTEFRDELPKLLSTFNLTTGKPAIQVFEGLDGFVQVLDETLNAKGEILTIAEPSRFAGKLGEINASYVAKRIAKKIEKRILVADIPENRAYFTRPYLCTQVRALPNFQAGLHTAIEVYDNSVALLTLSPEKTISVLLQDADIAASLRATFETLWKGALPVTQQAVQQ